MDMMDQDDSGVTCQTPGQLSRGLRIAFLVVCTVGALLSTDLLRLHVKVHTDPNYHSYCAVTEYVDCENVAFSDTAVFGGLPVALWGLLGYLFMGGLCIWGLRRNPQPETWPFGILFGLSLFSIGVSIFLFYISHFLIKSLCIVCTATYAVNVLLFSLAIGELRKQGSGPFSTLKKEMASLWGRKRPASAYILSFVSAACVLWLSVPSYWLTAVSTGPGGLLVGQTQEGAHWIGARKPVLEIVEFSDYQCPYCLRGHTEVRSLVEMNPGKVRLIHRHFPLRRHPHAFEYAKLAVCAGKQARFWEANDYIFANGRRNQPVTAPELAAALTIDSDAMIACMENAATQQEVMKDIAAGRSSSVRGTPTFIIEGKSYPGRIPPEVIAERLRGKLQ